MLRKEAIDDDEELDELIEGLEVAVKKAQRKEAAAAVAEVDEEPAAVQEEPTFPLLDVPDADLDEDQLKEKKKQRLLKAGYDARVRAKAEAEQLRRNAEEAARKEDEERERDPEGWSARVRAEHDVCVSYVEVVLISNQSATGTGEQTH